MFSYSHLNQQSAELDSIKNQAWWQFALAMGLWVLPVGFEGRFDRLNILMRGASVASSVLLTRKLRTIERKEVEVRTLRAYAKELDETARQLTAFNEERQLQKAIIGEVLPSHSLIQPSQNIQQAAAAIQNQPTVYAGQATAQEVYAQQAAQAYPQQATVNVPASPAGLELASDVIRQENLLKIQAPNQGEALIQCLGGFGIRAWIESAPLQGSANDIYILKLPPNGRIEAVRNVLEEVKMHLRLEREPQLQVMEQGLAIYIPRPSRKYYNFGDYVRVEQTRSTAGELRLPVGIDALGNLVEIDLADPNTPHIRGAGTTGSGKSEGLGGLLLGGVYRYPAHELQIALADGKGSTYLPLEKLSSMAMPIAKSAEEYCSMVQTIIATMETRDQLFAEARVSNIGAYRRVTGQVMPRIILASDEHEEMCDSLASSGEREELKNLLLRYGRLAKKGRDRGIHCLCFTQKPLVEYLPFRGNLPGAMAWRVAYPGESQIILGESELKAHRLAGNGDMIYSAAGREVNLQSLYVGLADGGFSRSVDRLHQFQQN